MLFSPLYVYKCQFLFYFFPQALLRTLSDLFNLSRYPLAGQLCHWCHGGRSSDLQHPLHRHLRLQLGPAGQRSHAGRAEKPDRAGPSARNSKGTAFICEFTLSVGGIADIPHWQWSWDWKDRMSSVRIIWMNLHNDCLNQVFNIRGGFRKIENWFVSY